MSKGRADKASLRDSDYRHLAQARSALRRLLWFSEDASRKIGLAPQQYQTLIAIRGYRGPGAPTVGKIADELHIEHHSATTMMDRMVEAGLLIRKRDDADRRVVTLWLTDKAEAVLSHLAAVHRQELRLLAPLMRFLPLRDSGY